ncbi:MAG: YdeI/OmpD-associated family protein [Archangiaceae bacterium]|nr:YdeI/OmpD-associated family protein [Archangiaceae bacterium]
MTTITPKNAAEWRSWLERHHGSEKEVWVRYVKTKHGRSMTWSDAVDEALCFGWIDTTARSIDDKHYLQRFTPRKANSRWSLVNKEKVERLTAAGLMAKAGLHQVALAKKNGQWSQARASNPKTEMPPELEAALNARARAVYDGLAPGYQNLYRRYVAEAKQAETRLKRAKLATTHLLAGHKNPFGVPQR